MSFNGYLIKLGGSAGTPLPITYMRYDTYKVTPNQRMDLDPTRDTTGLLHRNTLAHTATKIEFNTPRFTNSVIGTLNTLIQSAMSDRQARKIDLEYYDPETDSYKTGTFYMPDVAYQIVNVDAVKNIINYNETRYAFIEY